MFFHETGLTGAYVIEPEPKGDHRGFFGRIWCEREFAATGNLLQSPWEFRPGGASGIQVSDLFPEVRKRADDLCVIRSIHAEFTDVYGAPRIHVAEMKNEGASDEEARARCWLFDSQGLVVRSRAGLAGHKLPFAHEHAPIGDFAAAVRALRPGAIIGVAAVGGTFTPEVLGEMARNHARPIVFALSNPTSKSECTAEEAYRHTQGRALFACGSPFDPVSFEGRTHVPRQGNNSYIFPGVGLGVIASRARHVTDEMFMAAAHALANHVSAADLAQGSLYPALPRIREVSASIATAVAETAWQQGLAQEARPADLDAFIRGRMYDPRYRSYT